jgi:hypothetical protein
LSWETGDSRRAKASKELHAARRFLSVQKEKRKIPSSGPDPVTQIVAAALSAFPKSEASRSSAAQFRRLPGLAGLVTLVRRLSIRAERKNRCYLVAAASRMALTLALTAA